MGEYVFVGGQLFDGRQHREDCAVAVHGRRIVAVGEVQGVRRAAGPGADLVDLHGGLLLPGFQDAHLHPMVGGLERLRCELTRLDSVAGYLTAIVEHGAPPDRDGWFRGGGWSIDAFPSGGPTAELLDRAVPDRPAFIVSSDHHNAWVSSRALELAGIDASTPDPPDGWVELDEERARWNYPFRDIADSGADLAGGSDWPVNPPEPMVGVHGLVNRASYSPEGSPPDPLLPEQALTLAEALSAYTEGSARVSHRDDVGSIQVGARADLVVLDRDPFLGPPAEIGGARVVATFVEGDAVHVSRDA